MRYRERRQRDENTSRREATPTDDGGVRAQGQRLLAGVDEAIDRALSGDSRAFLDANRQEGGQ